MTMATRPRARERSHAARSWSRNRSAVRRGPTRPSNQPVAPIDQAEAVGFAVVAGRLDQALAAPSLAAPDPRQRGVKGNLHLILEVDIRIRKEGEQVRDIGGEVIPQIGLHQGGEG